MSLSSIIDYISDIIVRRSEMGKNFGIAVIPEGLIEFIPELKAMISNLNDIMPTLEKDSKYMTGSESEKIAIIENTLSSENSSVSQTNGSDLRRSSAWARVFARR